MRTIQSPGVEIVEKDLSLSPVLPAGTNIFMTGFAPKGPTDEVLQITSAEELENIYGIPTNSAERYFYFSARQILNTSQGNLFVNRLPYGDDLGEGYNDKSYGALVYPVVAVSPVSGVTIYRNTKLISNDFFNAVNITPAASGYYDLLVDALSSDGIDPYGYNIPDVSYYRKISTVARDLLLSAASAVKSSGLSGVSALGVTAFNTVTAFKEYPATEVSSDLTKKDSTFVLGAPKFFTLTKKQYLEVLDKSAFTNTDGDWNTGGSNTDAINSVADFGKAGLIVLNRINSTINPRGEGHYIGISDNVNIEPNSDHDSIRAVATVTLTGESFDYSQYTQIPEDRLAFALSAKKDVGTKNISVLVEQAAYQFSDAPTRKFDDSISLSLIKLRQSPYAADAIKLDYLSEESVFASMDANRQINDVNGGKAKSFFIQNTTQNSNNMVIMVNDNISSVNGESWIGNNGFPTKKIRLISRTTENLINTQFSYDKVGYDSDDLTAIKALGFNYVDSLYPLGPYASNNISNKNIGSLTVKLERALRKIENEEQFDLDLLIEAGLGTIYTSICANATKTFDDTLNYDGMKTGLEALLHTEYVQPDRDTDDLRANYHAIFSLFETFASKARKDCLFIADPLRQIFVTGKNTLVLSNVENSFSQYIYTRLRNLYSLANSSYACTYGNWVKINDGNSGVNFWCPFSGFAAADMANVDSNFQPWYAPAGFIRGRVGNALAVAITPNQKERDSLYKISVNPIAFFPNEGINIFGQKTLLKQPSAFDRINVRRLFLYLEKATKKTAKFFIFEPNTFYTRQRVVSTLRPIFERAKNTEGLYEYLLVCDDRNNTPDVIDQNELIVDIYIKPVRAAEFILINFYATRTSTNFNELIG